jgi:hypothetical protein
LCQQELRLEIDNPHGKRLTGFLSDRWQRYAAGSEKRLAHYQGVGYYLLTNFGSLVNLLAMVILASPILWLGNEYSCDNSKSTGEMGDTLSGV